MTIIIPFFMHFTTYEYTHNICIEMWTICMFVAVFVVAAAAVTQSKCITSLLGHNYRKFSDTYKHTYTTQEQDNATR